MKRRVFMALPAAAVAAPLAAPNPARAFRTEEATWEFVADLEETCAARAGTHDEIFEALTKVSRGQKLDPAEWRRLATCPFCRCQVAWAPPSEGAR